MFCMNCFHFVVVYVTKQNYRSKLLHAIPVLPVLLTIFPLRPLIISKILLYSRTMKQPERRATLQAYFLPASLLGVAGYGAQGLLLDRNVMKYFFIAYRLAFRQYLQVDI